MKTRFIDLKEHYKETFKEEKKLATLFERAEGLTSAGKVEFVKAFSFDFGLDGLLYIGSQKRLELSYPNINKEHKKLKIKLAKRNI